jgi:hypothetical protein
MQAQDNVNTAKSKVDDLRNIAAKQAIAITLAQNTLKT